MTYTGTHFIDVHSELVWGDPTSVEPLAPCDMVDHVRAGDDARTASLLADYIPVARGWVENEVQTSFVQRTATLYLDDFPCWEVELRLPPVSSVSSIAYLDESGDSTTLSSSLYRVDLTSKPIRITPAYGQLWPSTYPVTKAITITATVGYSTPESVPAIAKQAMRYLVAMMFNSGGALCDDGLEPARRMLDPLRWEGYR